jgi:hypothetical protein
MLTVMLAPETVSSVGTGSPAPSIEVGGEIRSVARPPARTSAPPSGVRTPLRQSGTTKLTEGTVSYRITHGITYSSNLRIFPIKKLSDQASFGAAEFDT